MLKKTISYTDYNGTKREEDFYFNFNKAELLEMEMSENGGISQLLQKMIKEQDQKRLVEFWKDMVVRAYGEKSNDGKRFIKNQELRDAFVQTEAYSILFMELTTNTDLAIAFVNGIIPPSDGEKAPVLPHIMPSAPTEQV